MGHRQMPLILLLSWLVGSVAGPGAQDQYDQFNAAIHRQLLAIDPAAEALFRQADDARLRGDHRAAADLYGRVVQRVPRFDHAMRRQALEELQLGNRRIALSLLDKAAGLDPSAENLSMHAMALIETSGEDSPTDADLARAGELARRACASKLNDPDTLAVCAQVAVASNDGPALNAYVVALARIEPDSIRTHYLSTLAAWGRRDFRGALASLELAHAAGLPEADYQSTREAITAANPIVARTARWVGIVLVVWLGGAVLLFGAGFLLSASALRVATNASGRISGRPGGMDAVIRRTYRLVLFASCDYYYLSIPLLLAVVLLGGGALLYGMLSVGHLPIKLLLIVAAAIAVTAWAIVKSLFVRGVDEDPGVRIHPDQHRPLWRLLGDIADRVGTRPVDAVFLTPGTEVAVFERGGLLRQMGSRTERCLILGVGVLEGLQLAPFKAVLAHEYGHFSNRDTAGGGFALAVRRSVLSLAMNLAMGGAAGWYNPVWLFVNGFHFLFLRISQGASRLQEVLADRWAATLYGAQAFENGLRHVIDRSVRFSAHADAVVQDAVVRKRPLDNLYRFEPTMPSSETDLTDRVRSALETEPSPYDSHPRPLDRFRWAHDLDVRIVPTPDDEMPVWNLFDDRAALEEHMTRIVRVAVFPGEAIA
jgi:Zn-dependent protease with chaperone function